MTRPGTKTFVERREWGRRGGGEPGRVGEGESLSLVLIPGHLYVLVLALVARSKIQTKYNRRKNTFLLILVLLFLNGM